MGKIEKNTVANLVSKIWSMFSIYLFIPIYINYLGEESYGIISFFSTLQAAMNILGLGLSNTLRREFAIGEDSDEVKQHKYKLLRSVELLYFIIAFVGSVVCVLLSPYITGEWLNIGEFDPQYIEQIVSLMGISICIQLIAHLYSGCLFGLDRQIEANIYSVTWSAVKNIGVVGIVCVVSKDLRVFYLYHIICDLVYTLSLRINIINKIRTAANKWSFRDITIIRKIYKYAMSIFVISIVALVNKQIDKIVISKYLSFTELGAYNLAITLGSLTTFFAIAMHTSVFSKFTSRASTGKYDYLTESYMKYNRMTNIITGCLGAFVSMFSIPLIEVWTGNNTYSEMLSVAAPIIVIATCVTEFQEVPYALALSYKNTRINMRLGIAYLPVVILLSIFGIRRYGLIGVAVVHLVIMLSQTIIYTLVVWKKYIRRNIFKYVMDTYLPLCMSYVIAGVLRFLLASFTFNAWSVVLIAVLAGGITLIFLMFVFEKNSMINLIQKFRKKVN